MTDGEKIVNAIVSLVFAERAVTLGAEFNIVVEARKNAAKAIDGALNNKATVVQAMGFGMGEFNKG